MIVIIPFAQPILNPLLIISIATMVTFGAWCWYRWLDFSCSSTRHAAPPPQITPVDDAAPEVLGAASRKANPPSYAETVEFGQ